MTNIPTDIRSALQPFSLSQAVQSHSGQRPDSVALVTPEQQLSYGELEYRVGEFARVLESVGVSEGATVWCFLPRHFDFVVTFIAVQRVNCTLVPLAVEEQPLRLRSLSQYIFPSALVYNVSDEERVKTMAGALNIRTYETPTSRAAAGAQLICRRCQASETTVASSPTSRCASYVNLTSGTTDCSKAAVCTTDNIFWNTKAIVERLRLDREDVQFCTFPVHIHPHEIFARSLYLGGTAVLMDFAHLCSDLNQLNRLGVTYIMSTPSLFDVLLRIQSAKDVKIPNLKLAESGGSITPRNLIRGYYERNSVYLTPVWGSAETSGVAMINPDPVAEPRALEALAPYYETEVVTSSGPAAIGELGELRLRGPAISQGYVNDSPGDAGPFRLGWYYTRDICRVVSPSLVVFEGRKNEIIKANGLAVFPAEVEAVLREIEGVRDVAVFGVGHDWKGEILAAAVVRQTGDKPSIREIVEVCRARLPFFSIPQHFEFVDTLPYEGAGKVSRKLLRETTSERILRRSQASSSSGTAMSDTDV